MKVKEQIFFPARQLKLSPMLFSFGSPPSGHETARSSSQYFYDV
jgi:hypothetical protein